MSFLQTLCKGRKPVKCGLSAMLALVCSLVLMASPIAEARGIGSGKQHKVIIQVDGQKKEIVTSHTKLHNVLRGARIKLGHHDEVRSSTPHITDGTVITVYRGVPVTLEAHGRKHEYVSGMPTVGEVLEQHGYPLSRYSSNPEPSVAVTSGMVIKVETLEEHAKRLQEEERIRAAKQKKPGPDYVKTEAGYLRFTEHFEMEATAYTADDGDGNGITATGLPAQYGVVAVDPDVIDLGTRLFIPGYGIAIAADTGGAIDGMIIDLCMDSYDECIEFGRQDVDVYVLAN